MTENIHFIELDTACIAFTNRHGGTSSKPYDSLNLGMHVGDNPVRVLQNRELTHQAISRHVPIASSRTWAFLNQTHENNVVVYDGKFKVDNVNPPTADASVTQVRNQPLVVMTADCGPLAIVGQSVVAVVHASWKSTSAGIISSTVEEMQYRAPSETFQAILGPCIHPDHYDFEEELLGRLASQLGEHVVAQTADGKPAFNLPAAITGELDKLDIRSTNIGIDTFLSNDHFSFRRDKTTGRQGVIVWRK